ncbi:MAG: protein translocase subunit SecDF [Mollicutes bacterium PWAP]|nr:protein translocase subunit SecDF [Mollicutes bacterium PWAP]
MPKNWKRMLILSLTILGTIIAIVFGATGVIAKDSKLGIEYGGGAELVVQVKSNSQSSDKAADKAVEDIYQRIDPLNIEGVKINKENNDSGSNIRIQSPLKYGTDQELKDLISNVTSKPRISMTDVYGNLLFDSNGHFNSFLTQGAPSTKMQLDGIDISKVSKVPIANNGAKAINNQGKKVEISLESNSASSEWAQATKYISSLDSSTFSNKVFVWLDLSKFINETKNTSFGTQSIWDRAGHNPVNAVYSSGKHSQGGSKLAVIIHSADYLISEASVTKSLFGKSFVIEGNFTNEEVQKLASKINYGVSDYSLKLISSNIINAEYGQNAFKMALIAGIIVFSIVALFLMLNYGLLGSLSTISIALYIFLTLLLFTVMRGEYSPETIAALVIGIGMAVDANIITFERLKAEVYSDNGVKKSNKKANSNSLSTIFDANITTLIVAFVLFFFGTQQIVALSITLIISIFFTLIVILGFTRIMSSLLINTGWFENKKWLLGIQPKIDKPFQNWLDKPDYIKSSKWFALGSGVLITAAVITFAITAGVAGTINGGLNLSQEFAGGAVVSIKADQGSSNNIKPINSNEISNIKQKIIDSGFKENEISLIYSDSSNTIVKEIKASTKNDVDIPKLNNSVDKSKYIVYSSNTTSDMAKKLVKDAMIAISVAFALIVLYTLIRFKWTYSVSVVLALVHDGLIVTAVFIFIRVEFSPVFIAGLLSTIGYSVNDTIVTFDRIRENMDQDKIYNKKQIKEVANKSIRETVKRSLLTSLTTISAVAVLMAFGNATKMSYNLSMFAGLIAGTYSSIFIASWIWVKLETINHQKRLKRKQNGFWKISGVQEETIKGINDFKE